MGPNDADTTFPTGFLWGAATAAHQIEGGNVNNDWWAWEHDPATRCVESSGDACDSFHRWPQDIDLAAAMGLGAYRFSLEWSRIEPAEGEFSAAALEHYRRMCAACHERDMVPVVTFHHFTNPLWLSRRGGWEAADAPEAFARFVERAVGALGDLIGWACTINELNAIGPAGYTMGTSPPGVEGDIGRHLAVNDTVVRAHRLAVEAARSGPGTFPVGLTLSMDEMVAEPGGEEVLEAAREILEDRFLRATGGDDFIGVQCYSRVHFGPEGEAPLGPGVPRTQMGYEYWPQTVEHCVRRAAAATGLPVLVTENGIATEDDRERIRYLSDALAGLGRCVDDGVDVRGYVVWSLLDNFEWSHGYRPRFGLHSVDSETFARHPKPSAAWFAAVARENRVVPAPA
ncbi:MAG TPA: family 1 glycosylhydrolase [Acidimicrobiales bacterium]|nr:family 1 glycosylhydrolase [Acidimicrobiales bacterium]